MKKIIRRLATSGLLTVSGFAFADSSVGVYSSGENLVGLVKSDYLNYLLVSVSGDDAAGSGTGGLCIGKAKLFSVENGYDGVLIPSGDAMDSGIITKNHPGLKVEIKSQGLLLVDNGFGVCGLNVSVSGSYSKVSLSSRNYVRAYLELAGYSYESALARYKEKDIKGALVELRPFIEGVSFDWHSNKADEKLVVSMINDYGYFLQQDSQADKAIKYLKLVVQYASSRSVARLNLGDAYWDVGQKELARKNYNIYEHLIGGAGLGKVPNRVKERLK